MSSQQDEEQPKMITPISFVHPSPEEKLRMNETVDEDFTTPLNSFNTIAQKLKIPEHMKKKKEGEEGLEDLKEKRKVIITKISICTKSCCNEEQSTRDGKKGG